MDIQKLFELGMKREIPQLIEPNHSLAINIGCGHAYIPGTVGLDYPSWDAEKQPFPYDDDSVTAIYAFHFLEHIPAKRAVEILREAQRVLKSGGTMNIVVPHYLGSMAYHDLDHKSYWAVDTLKNLFGTPYYDKNREEPWEFEIHASFIMGIVERNLAVFYQLVRK